MNRIQVPRAEADRTTFFGLSVPTLIKRLPKWFEAAQLDQTKTGVLFQAARQLVETPDQPTTDLATLAEQLSLSQVDAGQLLAATRLLLAEVVRIPRTFMKRQAMSDDLDYLHVPLELKTMILKLAYSEAREATDSSLVAQQGSRARLVDVQWRVDVAVSTSSMKRSLVPTVLMQLTLSDGTLRTFEAPVNQFHKLRYTAAAMLKEFNDMEAKPVFQA